MFTRIQLAHPTSTVSRRTLHRASMESFSSQFWVAHRRTKRNPPNPESRIHRMHERIVHLSFWAFSGSPVMTFGVLDALCAVSFLFRFALIDKVVQFRSKQKKNSIILSSTVKGTLLVEYWESGEQYNDGSQIGLTEHTIVPFDC